MKSPVHTLRNRLPINSVVLGVTLSCDDPTAFKAQAATSAQPEPNAEIASEWWPPLRNVWMPVGEGMYGLLALSLSDQTFSGCEHRHGIYGLPAPGALMFQAMRLAVIDDELEPGKLHLLRLAPLAWVKSDYQTRFENMPTRFGPVTFKFQLDPAGKTLNVTWTPQFRIELSSIALQPPPVPGLEFVSINSGPQQAASAKPIELREN